MVTDNLKDEASVEQAKSLANQWCKRIYASKGIVGADIELAKAQFLAQVMMTMTVMV